MMKTRRLAWTRTATSTPPAWSKAFGKLSRPAPKAAFTIRKMVAIVEVPPWGGEETVDRHTNERIYLTTLFLA